MFDPERDHQRFGRDIEALKQRICKKEGALRDLRFLKKKAKSKHSGPTMDIENTILDLLARIVQDPDCSWRDEMRTKIAEMKSLADDLEAVANRVERIAGDVTFRSQFWLFLFGMAKYQANDPAAYRTGVLIHEMRHYAQYNRQKASKFSSAFLRHRVSVEKNEGPAILSATIWKLTGEYHDAVVARLLTDAYETVGARKQFSADQIKKIRQRYLGSPLSSG